MGIPLVGRDFSRTDRLGGPGVAVVNQALVRQLFPGENPIGKHIWAGYSPTTERVEIHSQYCTRSSGFRSRTPDANAR
jgi:hypothetical protein